MQTLLDLLKRCAENHTFDSGDPDCQTVLDHYTEPTQNPTKTIHQASGKASKNLNPF